MISLPPQPPSEQSSQTFEAIFSSQDDGFSLPPPDLFWNNPLPIYGRPSAPFTPNNKPEDQNFHELPYPSYSPRSQISNLSYDSDKTINPATVALESPYDDSSFGFPLSSGHQNALTSPPKLSYFKEGLSDYELP